MKYIIRFQRNISRILFHILIKYIYIFLSYFLSRLWHFFFIGSHTHIHFLEMKYYFSFILTRGEIRFKLFIHYKTFKKKQKQNKFEK